MTFLFLIHVYIVVCFILKVSKFQKQIFLSSFPPKNERNYFLISAQASKMGWIRKWWYKGYNFVHFFRGNEDKKICFWNLLASSLTSKSILRKQLAVLFHSWKFEKKQPKMFWFCKKLQKSAYIFFPFLIMTFHGVNWVKEAGI